MSSEAKRKDMALKKALQDEAYKVGEVLCATYFRPESQGTIFYYINSGSGKKDKPSTKQLKIEALDPLTNPPVRSMQKETICMTDDRGLYRIEGHEGGTSEASAKYKVLVESEGREHDLAAQLGHNMWPSEQALISAVIAHEKDVDYCEAFGPEVGEALNTVSEGLYRMALDMWAVHEDKLPKASKRSEKEKASKPDGEALEDMKRRAEALAKRRATGEAEAKPTWTEAEAKAKADELAQVKGIGPATAKALLAEGFDWAELKRRAEAKGRSEALKPVSHMLNSSQIEALTEALPSKI